MRATRSILLKRGANHLICVCMHVAHYRTLKSIPNGYVRSSLCRLISRFRGITWPWTEGRATQIVARRKIAYDDRRSNEDECTPEWVDREIVLAA